MKTSIWKSLDPDTVILCIFIALSALIFRFPVIPILGNYFGAKLQLIEVSFVIVFPLWLIWRITRGNSIPKPPPGTVFLLAFVIVAFISSLLSINPKASLLDAASFLYLYLLLFFFYNLLSEKNLVFSLKFFLVVSAVVVSIGLLSLLLYSLFSIRTFALEVFSPANFLGIGLVRTRSTLFTSNYLLVYMGLAVAVGMTFLQSGEKGWVRVLSVIVILVPALIVISQPYRGEFIIWGIIFCGLGYFKGNKAIQLVRPLILALAVVFFLLSAAQGIITISPVRVSEDRRTHRLNLSISTLLTPYYNLHRAAIRMFREFPVVGIGPGLYGTYQEEKKYGFDFATYPEHANQDPHSTYLGYLCETGLAGAIPLFIFLGLVVQRLWELSRRGQGFLALFGQNAFVYFALLLIYAFYIDIVTMRFIYFMYALVFFMSITGGPEKSTADSRGR